MDLQQRSWKSLSAFALVLASCVTTSAHSATPEPKGVPRGEYVLRFNSGGGAVCPTFTANLNQFRNIDFGTCNPRLSAKYPEFIRPTWKEIPFDLELAKKLIQTPVSINWDHWLQMTKGERARGEVRMWRLELDLLDDGHRETLVRLDHVNWGHGPYCPYFDSYQMVLTASNPDTAKVFTDPYMRYRLGNDLIYDTKTQRYYLLNWDPYGSSVGQGVDFPDIGATASVIVSQADSLGGWPKLAPICFIDWLPANRRSK